MKPRIDVEDFQPDAIERAYQTRSPDDFLLFALGLRVPVGGGAKTLNSVIAPHQLETLQAVTKSLHQLRDGRMPECRRFWIERTKKASKDADLAIMLVWLIAFARRPFYAQVAAADKDQAAIVRRRMEALLHFNPWLKSLIEVKQYRVIQVRGLAVLDILAADIAGSHGETPDLLVCNELSHVSKWEFVENLLDNADGVAEGMVIIATNAGTRGSRPEVMRKNAIASQKAKDDRTLRWRCLIYSRPAPWHSEAVLADAKERNSPSRYARLWWGKWTSGSGDALQEDDIDRCLKMHDGPIDKPEKGWTYLAGLDLGISHDHAAMVIVGINVMEVRMRIAWMRAWAPDPKTKKVDLVDVQETTERMFNLFKLQYVGCDPYEARLMMQQLRRKRVPMQEMTFSSPKNLTLMASALVQAISGKVLTIEERESPKSKPGNKTVEDLPTLGTLLEGYDDEEGRLRRDFGKLNVVEKNYGYKLESVSDEYGHADVGVALAIVLPKAIFLLGGRVGLQETDDLDVDVDSPLTEEEMEGMPDDLRELYGEEGAKESAPRRRPLAKTRETSEEIGEDGRFTPEDEGLLNDEDW
jgi:hypothetical protein